MKTIKKYFKIAVMMTITAIVVLSSCIKDDDELYKANLKYFQDKEANKDTATWQWQYADAGVIPTGSGVLENELVGTNWLLTEVTVGLSSIQYNDTLHFISISKYYVNNDSLNKYTYVLQKIQNNHYSLTFQPFSVINHMQASTTTFGVGFTNIPVGSPIWGVFTDPYSTTKDFIVKFKKL